MEKTVDALEEVLTGSEGLSRESSALVAIAVHSFYNGIEGCIRLICKGRNIPLPSGERWHAELLDTALEAQIITADTASALRQIMAFRHVFRHAYFFDLDPLRLATTGRQALTVWPEVSEQISNAMTSTSG